MFGFSLLFKVKAAVPNSGKFKLILITKGEDLRNNFTYFKLNLEESLLDFKANER